VALKTARLGGKLNPNYTFASFVEGKSNQLARAAAMQVLHRPDPPPAEAAEAGG
jgi:chromosomal replication initiator protein